MRRARATIACGPAGVRSCADAGLGTLRLHDLRDTAASQAVVSGENLPSVGMLLGHRRYRQGYAHVADTHLVEAAERIGSIISGCDKGRIQVRLRDSLPLRHNMSEIAGMWARGATHRAETGWLVGCGA